MATALQDAAGPDLVVQWATRLLEEAKAFGIEFGESPGERLRWLRDLDGLDVVTSPEALAARVQEG